ncbi:MAG: ATP-binding protein, partial [Candidatus Gracilibacteria bacterium]
MAIITCGGKKVFKSFVLTKREWSIFWALLLVGTIIATLGSISLPVGNRISNFWPAVVIQVLGGLWFGRAGILAGIVFPLFSNYVIGGNIIQIISFVPANCMQAALPFMLYRLFNKKPLINDFHDISFYLFFAVIIPMFAAGFLGALSLYFVTSQTFSFTQYLHGVANWALIHIRILIVIGIPMMLWVGPKIVASPPVPMYWSDSKRLYPYSSLFFKIFAFQSALTLLPLLLICVYQIITLQPNDILRPNHLAIALNIAFFGILIISVVLVDMISRPMQLGIDKIVELSSQFALPIQPANMHDDVTFFTNFAKAVEDLCRKSIEYEKAKLMHQVSAQVAHDIRSPLAALDMAVKDTAQIPEEQRIIIRSAVSRIRDIANSLLEKHRNVAKTDSADANDSARGVAEPAGVYLLSSLIDPLITEKRLQFRSKIGVDIDAHLGSSSYGLFAKVQPTEFKRVLSNLINNSVEALDKNGSVILKLSCREGKITITVRDTGKGVSPEVLAKLGTRGETHGKSGGSGLGLYHARTSLESWGGTLNISSELGKGTT